MREMKFDVEQFHFKSFKVVKISILRLVSSECLFLIKCS